MLSGQELLLSVWEQTLKTVPLPRPRTVQAQDSEAFVRPRRQVYQSIREESLRAVERLDSAGATAARG